MFKVVCFAELSDTSSIIICYLNLDDPRYFPLLQDLYHYISRWNLLIPFQNQVVWGQWLWFVGTGTQRVHVGCKPWFEFSQMTCRHVSPALNPDLQQIMSTAWRWMNRENHLLPAIMTAWQGGSALDTVVNRPLFNNFVGFFKQSFSSAHPTNRTEKAHFQPFISH